ncbi:hypothetical protein PpBr36_01846 [Pyricularia pennisetigena]|uniref:hypothetical protein n=1 Tax=Pyricularia pennisetigena TaxID=1578925 RepID=UPI0011529638|nr:hypothetical protein PpBr36_01846 [Pyricularia pennisetigena]TLS28804.1 hypothetical protein PpBr36_01846 [Pyricularia pennisetigena]
MIIDGEKWACEACVRGHRVSNCQHSERPLQHINKKGRPVSQCQHCRSMRKSRASHVKCDCGEKTHKCAHLQPTLEGHRDSCCCNHGGRCSCSHKKDPPLLDPVPESDSDEPEKAASRTSSKAPSVKGTPRVRRRANTIHSDGKLSFDENGKHRPTYRHAKASSKCEPYPLKRVNSLQSASDGIRDTTVLTDSLDTSRKVKSETASPLLASGGAPSSFTQLNSSLRPLDLSVIQYPSYASQASQSTPCDALFSAGLDFEPACFSAGLQPQIEWSQWDSLDYYTDTVGDKFTPSSYDAHGGYSSASGFDFNGSDQAPTLATTTSGDVSEVEDFMGPSADDYDISSGFGNAVAMGSYGATGLLGAGSTGTGLSAYEIPDYTSEVPKSSQEGSLSGQKYIETPLDDSGLAAAGPLGAAFTEDALYWMPEVAPGIPQMADLSSVPEPNGLPWEPPR